MITLIATGFDDHQIPSDFQPRRMRAQTGSRERAYRPIPPEPAPRSAQPSPYGAPIMPDDDWDGEASIIRFLRER
jgi:hypothetical protein